MVINNEQSLSRTLASVAKLGCSITIFGHINFFHLAYHSRETLDLGQPNSFLFPNVLLFPVSIKHFKVDHQGYQGIYLAKQGFNKVP